MAAVDPERLLVSSVIHEGEIIPVLDARITEDFFNDDEHREVWRWTLQHWTKHSKVPDEITLKRNFPSWRLATTPEPIGHYVDQIRERRKYEIVQEAVLRAKEAVDDDDDIDGALTALALGVQQAHSQVSSLKDVVLTQDGGFLDVYEERARNPGRLRGMSTGFTAIDRATRGVQPEQYIVLAGPPKSAKSTLLLDIGITMNEENNARVLLIGFEMSFEEQRDRHHALRAGISYARLGDGRLRAKEKRALRKAIEAMENDYEDFVLSTDIAAATTVSGVRAKVEQIKPDVTLIDGIYLMEDEHGEPPGSPQALTNISRGLKRMAQATKIPIIGTTQALLSKIARGRGIEAASVGYTSAFGQDADVLLGVQRKPGADNMSELKVLLSRSGPLAYTDLHIDWETSTITEHEPEEDDDDDDDSSARPASTF